MYTSLVQINKTFDDHIHSLQVSGLPFNLAEIEDAREQAINDFLN